MSEENQDNAPFPFVEGEVFNKAGYIFHLSRCCSETFRKDISVKDIMDYHLKYGKGFNTSITENDVILFLKSFTEWTMFQPSSIEGKYYFQLPIFRSEHGNYFKV